MERPNQDLETTLRCMAAVNLPLLVSLVASQLTHSTEYWMFIEYVGPGSILWTGNAMALRSAPGFLPRTSWTLKLFKNFMLASPVVLKGTSGAVPREGVLSEFLLCYVIFCPLEVPMVLSCQLVPFVITAIVFTCASFWAVYLS